LDKAGQEKLKQFRLQMMEIEDRVSHNQIIEIRKQGLESLKSSDSRQQELEKVEAEIQKAIDSKIGYGLLMSSSQKQRIEKEIRESYHQQILEIKQRYDNRDEEISENI